MLEKSTLATHPKIYTAVWSYAKYSVCYQTLKKWPINNEQRKFLHVFMQILKKAIVLIDEIVETKKNILFKMKAIQY
jgi:hypothetical protein